MIFFLNRIYAHNILHNHIYRYVLSFKERSLPLLQSVLTALLKNTSLSEMHLAYLFYSALNNRVVICLIKLA
jgi:hypothetical protein